MAADGFVDGHFWLNSLYSVVPHTMSRRRISQMVPPAKTIM